METLPFRFYDEPIEVFFEKPPIYEKSPECPKGFIWRDVTYSITEILEEWTDFQRRGRMGRNMKPTHLANARINGSWGVGRFYFRIKAASGQCFDLYYDRAPEDCNDRKGKWFLKGERRPV